MYSFFVALLIPAAYRHTLSGDMQVYGAALLHDLIRQTAEHTDKFPIYVSKGSIFPEDGSLFGQYVTKRINA